MCVVQFSNDTRVELPLGPLDKPAFDNAIATMVSCQTKEDFVALSLPKLFSALPHHMIAVLLHSS